MAHQPVGGGQRATQRRQPDGHPQGPHPRRCSPSRPPSCCCRTGADQTAAHTDNACREIAIRCWNSWASTSRMRAGTCLCDARAGHSRPRRRGAPPLPVRATRPARLTFHRRLARRKGFSPCDAPLESRAHRLPRRIRAGAVKAGSFPGIGMQNCIPGTRPGHHQLARHRVRPRRQHRLDGRRRSSAGSIPRPGWVEHDPRKSGRPARHRHGRAVQGTRVGEASSPPSASPTSVKPPSCGTARPAAR